MRRGRRLQAIALGIFGLALALAPLSAASAATKSNSHHTTTTHHTTKTKKKGSSTPKKGSNPGSALCKDLRSVESSNSKLGSTISGAIEAGNYAAAKQDMLSTLNVAAKQAGPALSKLSSAPSNVRNAMKTLISFYNTFKTAIVNSSSLSVLENSLVQLSKNPQLAADGTIVSNYVTSQCGSLLPTTASTLAG